MWRELTEGDLRDALSAREIAAYTRAAAGPEWKPEAVAGILAKTADLARGYVASSPKGIRPGPGRSLPEALIGPAADYAAVTLLRLLPGKISEPRMAARREALDLFKSIAAGDVTPESDGPAKSPRVSALATPKSRQRASSAQLEGTP